MNDGDADDGADKDDGDKDDGDKQGEKDGDKKWAFLFSCLYKKKKNLKKKKNTHILI